MIFQNRNQLPGGGGIVVAGRLRHRSRTTQSLIIPRNASRSEGKAFQKNLKQPKVKNLCSHTIGVR
jgi:hypothetical protein